MGILNFFKKKDSEEDVNNQIVTNKKSVLSNTSSQALEPFLGNFQISDNIRQMLWFGDGKLQNYNPKNDEKVVFENELFRISFSFRKEPSLILLKLPVDCRSNNDVVEKPGYYPSYEQLNPQQRCVYLRWLCDITRSVNIGYVFIFYYGLERHLISGNYRTAVNTIITLRQYHKNPSFLSYSANALIIAAILHKDKETLIKVLDIIDDTSYCSSLVLLGKFLMQMDLTVQEIINLSSAVGFKNKRYIKDYPDLFNKTLEQILIKEFGKNSYPIYQLKMQYPSQPIMSFANISLDQEVRSPILPDLMQSPEFISSINTILTMTHNEVKQSLAEMRKAGTAPQPKSAEIDNAGSKPECPYCHNLLEKTPRAKRKCPHCKEEIIVRTDPETKKKILLKIDQVEEFEEKLQKIRCHKTIQRIFDGLNINPAQLDQTKKNLKMKMGIETTEKDVALEIIDNLGYYYFKNLDMGLFRNTILEKGDIYHVSGDLRNAMTMYLELCYIDLNGPNNRGSVKGDERLLQKYPPFDPNSRTVFLAPGIINNINQIAQEMNLSKEEIKQIFFEHNQTVEKCRKLPLSAQNAWLKLEPELIL